MKNRYFQRTKSTFWFSIIGISLNLIIFRSTSAQEVYQEYITFHEGRKYYNAGEQILYKAYCWSNRNDRAVMSKVLYIELVDKNQKSVLHQSLQINNQAASAVLQLPDTLATDMYFLKGYTQWMKNFGESEFASIPLFIYNQYDAEKFNSGLEFSIPFVPEIFIQGGKLISGLTSRIRIKVPCLFPESVEVTLQESGTSSDIQTSMTDYEGNAEFMLTPKQGKLYQFSIKDSINGNAVYTLPSAEYGGYSLDAFLSENDEFIIKVNGSNTPSALINAKLVSGDETVWENNIQSGDLGEKINTHFKVSFGGYKMLLTDAHNTILTEQQLMVSPVSETIQTIENYSTNQEVEVKMNLSGIALQKNTGLSVSVSKAIPDMGQGVDAKSYSGDISSEKELQLILPRYYSRLTVINPKNFDFPVEDLGMLFTGHVINYFSKPTSNPLQTVLVVKDTLGPIVAAEVSPSGSFAMLLNEFDNKEANILLFRNDMYTNEERKISIDEKYFYRSPIQYASDRFVQKSPQYFYDEMQNESKRVLIQKAFGNNIYKPEIFKNGLDSARGKFYGEPEIIVFPGIYFFLPNFEEIAREILPRVRYKHTRDKCELIIYLKDNSQATSPIILIDGNYISDPNKLYELDSDDIQRIEIQSGIRVSGQLLYKGLLAIYTTNKYKMEKKIKDDRKVYPISGYMNSNKIFYGGIDLSETQARQPNFANQLYWNPVLIPDQSGSAEFNFTTSDEEGMYIINIMGITPEGIPLHYTKKIEVKSSN